MKITSQLLQGIFLIMLTIVGTTVENTFSCQTLRLLHNNSFAKQIVILCLIYFTVDFTDDKNSHPLETLKSTLLIWVCYIVVSKQTLHFTIGIFIILVMLYISHNYKDYLDDQLKKNTNKKELQEQSKFVNSLIEPLKYMLFILASIGFIYYFMKESREHKKNFSYLKFLFGANKCDHDK